MSFIASMVRDSDRAASQTLALCWYKILASSLPTPLEAPVTMKTYEEVKSHLSLCDNIRENCELELPFLPDQEDYLL